MKMFCISSATKDIIMEVPQKIQINMFSVALANNGISILIFLQAPAVGCIFRGTCHEVFSEALPLHPGETRGCSTKTVVNNLLTESVSHPLPQLCLRRRQAQTVR